MMVVGLEATPAGVAVTGVSVRMEVAGVVGFSGLAPGGNHEELSDACALAEADGGNPDRRRPDSR